MTDPDDTLDALREALAVSPDNVVLRRQVVKLLLQRDRHADAEQVLKDGLRAAPQSESLKLTLAECFYAQGKYSEATVVVEELLQRPGAPAQARLLYARLLLRQGDLQRAGNAYREAVKLDPKLADGDLDQVLGGTHRDSDDDDDEEEELPWGDDDVDEYGRIRARRETPDDGLSIEIEKPDIDFNDVGGMDALKDEIRIKIIEPMNHPEIYEAYGKKIGGGILMYGPPGCGKTHLARATAGQIDAGFMPVGIHDVMDMYIGQSERKLHALFENARGHTPCVLFFDEVDALGASRSDMRNSAGRNTINQFLSELDGVKSSNDGVLVLAATNAPWHLDAAFRRPGRFDRIIFVPPPDQPSRESILRVLLKGKPTEGVDLGTLAKKTAGFSGADLKAVIDTAVEAKLRDAMSTGRPTPLRTKDLTAAAKRVKPSTKEWFATAKNYALYSNEAGLYDDILSYLKLK
jgi:AAA+ superfamily predicted ATPase/Tfp pilus assembly protein PilF